MSSAIQPPYAQHPPRQPVQPAPHGAASMHSSSAPAGTFAPGTKVQVGASRVVIERYLSEGGFAHVYLVRLPKPIGDTDKAVLKRVAVPDKEALANMRTEVETMKKLKGHKQIVTYFDSHASQLNGGGYEVFLLMEFCSGGGLIDFMNTRLQNRLTEPEILKIFSDTAQGVACMHYLKPPLLHRDLKVENILINDNGPTKQFKLCDFGSAAAPRPAATSAAEGRMIEEDVQKHTTMQYRSPEMIDVYRKQPIDEKSDIWALGVLLYKLCYYTTPFEEQGQMAILNASFKYPGYPRFSDRLKKLIAMMLQERPSSRPNIYQVVREVCSMRGTECPIRDIYTGRTASEARKNQELPPPPGQISSPPIIGASKVAPVEEKVTLPDITPMRRGRPTSTNMNVPGQTSTQPSPSPRRGVGGDPFAALDSNGGPAAVSPQLDDATSRFPSLDQFSLLHESGNTFDFENNKPHHQRRPSEKPRDISVRVSEALADEAFASIAPAPKDIPKHTKSVPNHIGRNNVSTQTAFSPPSPPKPQVPPKSSMVSTGTMTDPKSPQEAAPSPRPIFRFPSKDNRSSSQPRPPGSPNLNSPKDENLLPARPSLLDHRSKSQTLTVQKSTSSTRPSLDAQRPLPAEIDTSMSRSRSTNSRSRPVSTHLENAANFIKGRSSSRSRDDAPDLRINGLDGKDQESGQINSNVDFLKAMEEEEAAKRKEKRTSSGSKHIKRASMPSVSLSGTKNLLAGRFGEAFRRFETNGPQEEEGGFSDSNNLTPIAGSEATDGRSDDGQAIEETEEMSPEMRRELERRRLSQEERRVAEAAAAYKQGLGGPPRKDSSRAASIQNKVQSLLDESSKASPTKTAEGYGRFTNSPAPIQQQQRQGQVPQMQDLSSTASRQIDMQHRPAASASSTPVQPTDSPTFQRSSLPPKPQVKPQPKTQSKPQPRPQPKPQALRTGGSNPPVAAKPSNLSRSNAGTPLQQQNPDQDADDWEANFSKKYPSLSGLEMVETEISGKSTGGRVRDI